MTSGANLSNPFATIDSRTILRDISSSGTGEGSGMVSMFTADSGLFAACVPSIVPLYLRAFQMPENSEATIVERLHKHRERDRFVSVIATGEGGKVAGFAYGYVGGPGDAWHDLVSGAMGETKASQWMSNAFELVELAVDPQLHKQGIGGELLTSLMQLVDSRTALLSVQVDNQSARKLYEKHGWQILVEKLQMGDKNHAVFGYEFGQHDE
jgi:ribosomal protein S18 acetylase RimI-like enzyme